MWTRFVDMYSGGGNKYGYDLIYVEAPETEAIELFKIRFGDPYNITCECCGEDFSISESEWDSLDKASLGDREVGYGENRHTISLEDWLLSNNVLVIQAEEI